MHIDRGSNENNNSPIPNWAPEWQSVTTDHAEDAVSSQSNLAALLHIAPGRSTAVIVPELGIRITYDSLRQQVMVALVAFFRSGKAGILPHRPKASTVHVCLHASCIRKLPRLPKPLQRRGLGRRFI